VLLADDDIEQLYREVVLDHYRAPRNRARLAAPTGRGVAVNRVCGDEVEVEVRLERGEIAELSARAVGCSLAIASASVLTELARGLEPAAAGRLGEQLARIVEGDLPEPGCDARLRAFAPVAALPARRRCALLAWEALGEALDAAGAVPGPPPSG
jgi:nitrogen fixation NifU-like protein